LIFSSLSSSSLPLVSSHRTPPTIQQALLQAPARRRQITCRIARVILEAALSTQRLVIFFMPEFSLSERLENAHEEPIWAVTHVKDNIFATGSLDESVKLWWASHLEHCCQS
jgi:hypothetical protein